MEASLCQAFILPPWGHFRLSKCMNEWCLTPVLFHLLLPHANKAAPASFPCLIIGRLSRRRMFGVWIFQQMREGFDAQFGGHDRFGDEVVAAAEEGTRARLEIGPAGDENHRGCFMERQAAHLFAEGDAVQ